MQILHQEYSVVFIQSFLSDSTNSGPKLVDREMTIVFFFFFSFPQRKLTSLFKLEAEQKKVVIGDAAVGTRKWGKKNIAGQNELESKGPALIIRVCDATTHPRTHHAASIDQRFIEVK